MLAANQRDLLCLTLVLKQNVFYQLVCKAGRLYKDYVHNAIMFAVIVKVIFIKFQSFLKACE